MSQSQQQQHHRLEAVVESDHSVRIRGSTAPRVVDSSVFDFCGSTSNSPRHERGVLAASADGRVFATATARRHAAKRGDGGDGGDEQEKRDEDGSAPYHVQIWSAETGALLASLGEHIGKVSCVAFFSDARAAVTAEAFEATESPPLRYSLAVATLDEVWIWSVHENDAQTQQQPQQHHRSISVASTVMTRATLQFQDQLEPSLRRQQSQLPFVGVRRGVVRLPRTVTCLAVATPAVAAGHDDGSVSVLHRHAVLSAQPAQEDDDDDDDLDEDEFDDGAQHQQQQLQRTFESENEEEGGEKQLREQHQQQQRRRHSRSRRDREAKQRVVSFEWRAAHRLVGHEPDKLICCVAFTTPDATTLMSGAEDGTFRLWNVESGRERAASPAAVAARRHPSYVLSCAASHSGAVLATGCLDNAIRLWDPFTGFPIVAATPTSSAAATPTTTSVSSTRPPLVLTSRCCAGGGISSVAFVGKGGGSATAPHEILVSANEGSVLVWRCTIHAQSRSGTATVLLRLYQQQGPAAMQVGAIACLEPLSSDREQQLPSLTAPNLLAAAATVMSSSEQPRRQRAVGGGESVLSTILGAPPSQQHFAFGAAASRSGSTMTTASSAPFAATSAARVADTEASSVFYVAMLLQPRDDSHDGDTNRVNARVSVVHGATGVVVGRPLEAKLDANLSAAAVAASANIITSTSPRYIFGTAFSPDAKLAASAHADGTARLWDVQSGRELAPKVSRSAATAPALHSGKVRSVCFSRDGALLVTASEDRTVRVLDVATRAPVRVDLLALPSAPASPTEAAQQQQQAQAQQRPPLTGSPRSASSLPPAAALQEPEPASPPSCAPRSRTGLVATLPRSASARGASVVTTATTATATARAPSASAAASPSPQREPQPRSTFTVTSARSPSHRAAIQQQQQATSPTSSPQQAKTTTADLVLTGHESYVYCAVFSPLVPWIVASCSHDRTVRVWNLRRVVEETRRGVAGRDGDAESDGGGDRESVLVLRGHTNDVISVSFSPTSCLLASASHDKDVRVWNAERFMTADLGASAADASNNNDNACVAVLSGHTAYVNAVCFAPSGRVLASASDDASIRVWRLQQQPCQFTFALQFVIPAAHSSWIYSLSFSPDGAVLASASRDRTVRFWNASTGAPRSQQPRISVASGGNGSGAGGGGGRIRSAVFSPDGSAVVSGGADGALRFWGVLPTAEGFTLNDDDDDEGGSDQASEPLVAAAMAARCAAVEASVPVDFVLDFPRDSLGAVVAARIGTTLLQDEDSSNNSNSGSISSSSSSSSFCTVQRVNAAVALTAPWRPLFNEQRHRRALAVRQLVEAEAIHRQIVALHEIAGQLLELQRAEARSRCALRLSELVAVEPLFRVLGYARATAALTTWGELMERHFRLRRMQRRVLDAETGAREWIWIAYLATAPHTRDRLVAQLDDVTARATGTDVTVRRGAHIELRLRGGHTRSVTCGAIAADGKAIVTGSSFENRMLLWRMSDGLRAAPNRPVRHRQRRLDEVGFGVRTSFLWTKDEGGKVCGYPIVGRRPQLPKRGDTAVLIAAIKRMQRKNDGDRGDAANATDKKKSSANNAEGNENAVADDDDDDDDDVDEEQERQRNKQLLEDAVDIVPLGAGPCRTCGRSYESAPFEWRCECGHGELWPLPSASSGASGASVAGAIAPSPSSSSSPPQQKAMPASAASPGAGTTMLAVTKGLHNATDLQRADLSSRDAVTCMFCGNDYASSAVYHSRKHCYGCGRFMCSSCVAMSEVLVWPPSRHNAGKKCHDICYDCCARASTQYLAAVQAKELLLRERKERREERAKRQREREERAAAERAEQEERAKEEAEERERKLAAKQQKQQQQQQHQQSAPPSEPAAAANAQASNSASSNSNNKNLERYYSPAASKSNSATTSPAGSNHSSASPTSSLSPRKNVGSTDVVGAAAAAATSSPTARRDVIGGADGALYSPGGSTATSRAGSAASAEINNRSPKSPRSRAAAAAAAASASASPRKPVDDARSPSAATNAEQQPASQLPSDVFSFQLPPLQHIVSAPPCSTPAAVQLASLANAVTQLAGFDLGWTLARARAELTKAEAAMHIVSAANSSSDSESDLRLHKRHTVAAALRKQAVAAASAASTSGDEENATSDDGGGDRRKNDEDDEGDSKHRSPARLAQESTAVPDESDGDNNNSRLRSPSAPSSAQQQQQQLEYEHREQLRRASADIRTALSSIGYSREDAATTTVAAAIAATLRRIKEHPTFPQGVASAISSLHSVALAAALVTANRPACRQLFARIVLVLPELVRHFNREPQPQHQARRLRSADINGALQAGTFSPTSSPAASSSSSSFNARLSALVQEAAAEFNVYAVEEEVVAGLEQHEESASLAAADERYKQVLLAKLSHLYYNLVNRERNFEQLHERTGKVLDELQQIRERMVAARLLDEAASKAAAQQSKTAAQIHQQQQHQQFEHVTRATQHLRSEQHRAVAAMQWVLCSDTEQIRPSDVVFSRSTPPQTVTSAGVEVCVLRRATVLGNTPVTIKTYQPEYRHLSRSEYQVLRVLHDRAAAAAAAPTIAVQRQQLFVNAFGTVGDGCSVVLELTGDSLATRIQAGLCPLGNVSRLRITLALVTAIAELHTLAPSPLFHRDFTPSAVRFPYKSAQEACTGVKVANLGFAVTTDATWLYSVRQILERDRQRSKLLLQQQRHLMAAQALEAAAAEQRDDLASLAYAPPEAFFARTAAATFDEAAADCYSLGATLCDLWTRRPAFWDVAAAPTSSSLPPPIAGGPSPPPPLLNLDAVVSQKRKGVPPATLDSLVDEFAVPPVIAGVIAALCDADPKKRPAAADVRDRLHHLLAARFAGDAERLLLSSSSSPLSFQTEAAPPAPQQQSNSGAAAAAARSSSSNRAPRDEASSAQKEAPAATNSSSNKNNGGGDDWIESLTDIPADVKVILRREMILDLGSLRLLTESDLKEIGVPLGPRKLLLKKML